MILDPAGALPGTTRQVVPGNAVFVTTRPHHTLNYLLARRKAVAFSEVVNAAMQNQINGALDNLYSRIALLDASGHPLNEKFRTAQVNK